MKFIIVKAAFGFLQAYEVSLEEEHVCNTGLEWTHYSVNGQSMTQTWWTNAGSHEERKILTCATTQMTVGLSDFRTGSKCQR